MQGTVTALFPIILSAAGTFLFPLSYATATMPGRNGRIAFVEPTSRGDIIYRISPDGSHRRALTSGADQVGGPQWSPDGRLIAFQRATAKAYFRRAEIYTMHPDGTRVHRLTSHPKPGPLISDFDPTWSPSGSHIVIQRHTSKGYWLLVVMKSNGTQQRRLTQKKSYVEDDDPDWSPTGNLIAFSSNRRRGIQIFTIHPDGTHLRQLTEGTRAIKRAPSWSPNGRKLLFTLVSKTSRQENIMKMDRDGSHVVRIHKGAQGSWSPNGRWVVFVMQSDLYKMRPNGSHVTRITSDSASQHFDAAWEPTHMH